MTDFFNTKRTFLTAPFPEVSCVIFEPLERNLGSGYYTNHFMTLVIALACKNGVVLGADGLSGGYAHEFLAPEVGMFFFLTYPECKITSLGEHVLWGAAGTVDIIQAIEAEFEALPSEVKNKTLHDSDLREFIKEIHHRCVENGLDQQKRAGIKKKQRTGAELILVNNDVNQVNPIKIWYLGYLRNFFVEKTGCGVIGDGTFYAQMSLLNFRSNLPFLAPQSRSLSTEQGALVVYRAIRDAIETGRNVLGPPIDIWTIKDEAKPKQWSRSDKEKLKKAYFEWKKKEVNLLRELI